MRSILDRLAPMTSKRVFARPSAPWMSINIVEAKRQRRKAERTWRSPKCQSDLAVFKRKRNHATFLMNEARRVYYSTLIAENSRDKKYLFKVSKKVLNITGTPVLPPHEEKQKLANEMGMIFIKKIADIRLDLDNHDNNKLPQTAFPMTSKLILYSSSLFLCLKKKCTTWFEHPVRSLVA